jgi:hypothetical protein
MSPIGGRVTIIGFYIHCSFCSSAFQGANLFTLLQLVEALPHHSKFYSERAFPVVDVRFQSVIFSFLIRIEANLN